MPFTPRQSLAAVALGLLTDALILTLGVTVPLGDPLRDSVDNSLLMLGGSGVLIALAAPRSRMFSGGPAARAGLAAYGVLSLASVMMVDFGAWERVGWAVKAAAAVVFALSLRELRRTR